MPKTKAGNRAIEVTNDDWTSHLGKRLYSIQGVESVYIQHELDHIDVWVVIPIRDEYIMKQIFEVENEIVAKFSLTEHAPLFFDFHIVYRNGSNEKDLLYNETVLLPR